MFLRFYWFIVYYKLRVSRAKNTNHPVFFINKRISAQFFTNTTIFFMYKVIELRWIFLKSSFNVKIINLLGLFVFYEKFFENWTKIHFNSQLEHFPTWEEKGYSTIKIFQFSSNLSKRIHWSYSDISTRETSYARYVRRIEYAICIALKISAASE